MQRHIVLIASVLALAACNRAPAPSASAPDTAPAAESQSPSPATIATPAAPTPPQAAATPVQPAPMPEGSFASYQCDDGVQVEVRFNGIAASVAWPDGRTARLSQPATTAEGQPQVYAGKKVRIERAADGLHLRDGDAAETVCTETEASA